MGLSSVPSAGADRGPALQPGEPGQGRGARCAPCCVTPRLPLALSELPGGMGEGSPDLGPFGSVWGAGSQPQLRSVPSLL